MRGKDIESAANYCDDHDGQPLLIHCPPEVRVCFVKRVYALLSLQLLFTGAVSAVCALEPVVRNVVLREYAAINIVSGVCGLVSVCVLFSFKDRHPWNLLLLFVFTICESVTIGTIVAVYCDNGRGMLVVGALAATTALFSALSIYVHVTKQEFAFLSGLLFVSLVCLIGAGLVSLLWPSMLLDSIVAAAGIVVFSGFVLHDTSDLIKRMGPDDAIIAVVHLYLDVVNLFLYMLQLLTSCSSAE